MITHKNTLVRSNYLLTIEAENWIDKLDRYSRSRIRRALGPDVDQKSGQQGGVDAAIGRAIGSASSRAAVAKLR
jgi:hypothetical protein